MADPRPHAGPLLGLYHGLAAASGAWFALAPCDIPLLSPETYQRLWTRALDTDEAAVATFKGQVQPLVGIYQRAATMTAVRSVLKGRRHCMRALLDHLPHTALETPEVELDLNTPADADRFKALSGAPWGLFEPP